MGIGDHRVWTNAAKVRVGHQVWVDAAERSYQVLWVDEPIGTGLCTIWVRGDDGRPTALPPIEADEIVIREVMT